MSYVHTPIGLWPIFKNTGVYNKNPEEMHLQFWTGSFDFGFCRNNIFVLKKGQNITKWEAANDIGSVSLFLSFKC